jgi:hypothetical protein
MEHYGIYSWARPLGARSSIIMFTMRTLLSMEHSGLDALFFFSSALRLVCSHLSIYPFPNHQDTVGYIAPCRQAREESSSEIAPELWVYR